MAAPTAATSTHLSSAPKGNQISLSYCQAGATEIIFCRNIEHGSSATAPSDQTLGACPLTDRYRSIRASCAVHDLWLVDFSFLSSWACPYSSPARSAQSGPCWGGSCSAWRRFLRRGARVPAANASHTHQLTLLASIQILCPHAPTAHALSSSWVNTHSPHPGPTSGCISCTSGQGPHDGCLRAPL